ncbi:hypothetical protein ABQ333_26730 [Serratia fonticola]|uniref:hypothetical protein n=1 Tax=Serratia fonticola TaxID=47917 RepID=UPI003AAEB360
MKFMLFKNFSGSINASIDKKTIPLIDSSNDKNIISKIVTADNRSEKKRIIDRIEQALTNFSMYKVAAGNITLNNKFCYVAMSEDESKCVVIAFVADKGKRASWKTFTVELQALPYRDKQSYDEAFTGNMIEWTGKVEYATDKKIDDVRNEVEDLKRLLAEERRQREEETKKRVAAENKNAALIKFINNRELSVTEEFLIVGDIFESSSFAEETVQKDEIKTDDVKNEVEKNMTKESDQLVFSLTKPAATINEPLIVCSDQSARTNRANFYNPTELASNTLSARDRRLQLIREERLAA